MLVAPIRGAPREPAVKSDINHRIQQQFCCDTALYDCSYSEREIRKCPDRPWRRMLRIWMMVNLPQKRIKRSKCCEVHEQEDENVDPIFLRFSDEPVYEKEPCRYVCNGKQDIEPEGGSLENMLRPPYCSPAKCVEGDNNTRKGASRGKRKQRERGISVPLD